jgi:hypothetical protein
MPTQHRKVITKILVSAAIALGSCIGGAAPASAEDPNPIGTEPNLFGGLHCSCQKTAPPGSPALREEVERGLQEGHSAWLPGLPPPTQPRQPQSGR